MRRGKLPFIPVGEFYTRHAEVSYLKSLATDEQQARCLQLCQQHIPCVVVSRHLPVPKALTDAAAQFEIAIFRTPMVTMRFINAATIGLEMDFAPTITEHGSMVDIMGVGALVRGSSGVGKSECVLGLIERGYSLVSDDV